MPRYWQEPDILHQALADDFSHNEIEKIISLAIDLGERNNDTPYISLYNTGVELGLTHARIKRLETHLNALYRLELCGVLELRVKAKRKVLTVFDVARKHGQDILT